MANSLKFGNGKWATNTNTVLAYNDENENFKPLPFTFSRASSATVVNQNGLIETVGSGEPRIDFQGNTKGALLLEPSRTNLQVYSEQFDNAAWTKTNLTVNTNQTISPNGELTAGLLTTTSASGSYVLDVAFVTAAQKYNYSVFVKKSNVNFFAFVIVDGVNVIRQYYDINNGVVGSSVNSGTPIVENIKIENYGNGWYRCSLTIQALNSAVEFRNYVIENDGIATAAIGSKIFLWGAQIEQGSYATSYIPTQGAAVTRAIDSCVQYNLPTSVINSAYPFSIYVKAQPIVDGNNKTIISFLNTATSNQYYDVLLYSNGQIHLEARANGSTESLYSGQSVSTGDTVKVCMVMESATSGKICVNGQSVQSKTNFANQAVNSSINSLIAGQLRTNGDTLQRVTVNEIQLYNTALTDQEIIALTTL